MRSKNRHIGKNYQAVASYKIIKLLQLAKIAGKNANCELMYVNAPSDPELREAWAKNEIAKLNELLDSYSTRKRKLYFDSIEIQIQNLKYYLQLYQIHKFSIKL